MSDAIHSRSRGIVVFTDMTALLWEHDDGHQVVKWADSFDSAKSEYAKKHGGLLHAVVYMLINSEVIYETDH